MTVEEYRQPGEFLWSAADEHALMAVLLSPTGRVHVDGVLERVNPEDFVDAHFGLMWKSARAIRLRGDRISRRTLLAEKDTPPIRSRLDQLGASGVSEHEITKSADTVRELGLRRKLAAVAERITDYAIHAGDYSQALDRAISDLTGLTGGEVSDDLLPFDTLGRRWFEDMANPAQEQTVIPTPWPELDDRMSGGLHPGRVYLVAGRPGSGKSLIGLNLAQYAAELGHPALVVSAEMRSMEITTRLMAAGGHAEYGELTRRHISDYTNGATRKYFADHGGMPLHIADRPDVTVESIASTARTFKRQHGLDVLVVDYLQLIAATDRSVIREQQVAHISRSLKLLSAELNCALVLLAQLNRNNTKENRKPLVSDLRESGSLEQDADMVALLHHTEKEGQPTGEVELIVGKNRQGPTGSVMLRWRAHQARITS